MFKLRGISIPDDAEKIYTREYFQQLGVDTANKMIAFMRARLDELNEE